MSDYFIMDGKRVIPVSPIEWGQWFSDADLRIRQTPVGPYWISTIFIGSAMGDKNDRPLIYETAVFRGQEEVGMYRSASRKEALAIHRDQVRHFQSELYRKNPERYRAESIRSLQDGKFMQFAAKYRSTGDEL